MLRIRIIVIAVVATISLLMAGFQQAYLYVANPAPVRMTCGEFLLRPPTAKWVELSDCHLDFHDAIVLRDQKTHEISATYVPVRPAGAGGLPRLLMKVNRPEDERLVQAHAGLVNGVRPAPQTRTLNGVLDWGVDLITVEHDALRRSDRVAEKFAVIVDGETPNPGGLVFMLSMILLVLGWLVLMEVRRARLSEVPPADEWVQWSQA